MTGMTSHWGEGNTDSSTYQRLGQHSFPWVQVIGICMYDNCPLLGLAQLVWEMGWGTHPLLAYPSQLLSQSDFSG